MTVQFSARYLGNKKMELMHGPSGAKLVTAAPVDNQGDGSSFSPTDLCASSLAVCMMTIMAINAEREGINLTGMWAESAKEMSSEPPRRIARIPVTIHMPRDLKPAEREKLERIARACPVSQSLGEAVETPLEFHYDA